MAGIYVHIPFCKQACHYCNFHFSASTKLLEPMVQAVCKEIELQQHFFEDPTLVIDTIYFGGGTPSLLPTPNTAHILDTITKHFTLSPTIEITLEANPDDISIEKLSSFKSMGINRLSMGVQSFVDQDLIWMNRAHRSEAAIEAIKRAQEVGISNISIDLIYGIPTLSHENWIQNIDTALMERTNKAGYEQYEFSNFALPGYRSKHNTSYWQQKKYLGIGPSAHSFTGNSRQWNIANNALYISSIENNTVPFESEILSTSTQYNEYMMTSLRTIEGCSFTYLEEKFGAESVVRTKKTAADYIDKGQLIEQGNYLQATAQGKFFLDGIAADFF